MKLAGLLLIAPLTLGQIPEPLPTPPPPPEPKGPVVVLHTTEGEIRIGLYSEHAPLTVANFLEYVRSGHYVGTIFHRVIPRFMVQGGGFDEDLNERPTRAPIRNEARNGLRNSRGTVAMARLDAPDSATDQFFINLKDNHRLDFGIAGAGYAVFGKVLDGMDVVDEIAVTPTETRGEHEDVPINPITIVGATIEEPPPAPAPSQDAAPADEGEAASPETPSAEPDSDEPPSEADEGSEAKQGEDEDEEDGEE